MPVIDDIRGRVVEVYVSLKPGFEPGKALEGKVSTAIDNEIGKIARPKNVWIVPDMPKTRSGKIVPCAYGRPGPPLSWQPQPPPIL